MAIVVAVSPTPIRRPTWLKVTSLLAAIGAVVWPVMAMLGLLGVLPAQAVLNVGIVTAVLAYVSIRRIKQDRAIAMGESGEWPESSPDP